MKKIIYPAALLLFIGSSCSKQLNEELLKPTLTIEKDVYEYLNVDKTGAIPVTVSGGIDWTVELLAEQAWFSAEKDGDEIALTMDENEDIYERVAKIRINTSEEGLNKIIVVKQHGNTPTILIDTDNFVFESDGGNGEVVINSNMEWTLSTQVDWITWEKKGNKVVLIVKPNEQPGERSTQITVNTEVPILNKSITITQKGTVSFEIDKRNIQFGSAGGTEEIQITSSQEWTYETSENTDWFTVSREGDRLTVVAAKNNFVDQTGTLTVTIGLVTVDIQLRQTGLPVGTALDRQVLIAIYTNMGGANWDGTKWNIDAPLDEAGVEMNWSGVKVANVNGAIRVTEINLSSRNLQGEIPKQIGYLSELANLNMVNNNWQITGELPESIGNLRKLHTLILSRSNLTGTIPTTFRNLTELTTLQIHTCQLEGSLPANVFGNLTKLASIEIKDNKLSGDLPQDLIDHPNRSKWNMANICPQQAGYGFTNCP